jgi:hypothetical protein
VENGLTIRPLWKFDWEPLSEIRDAVPGVIENHRKAECNVTEAVASRAFRSRYVHGPMRDASQCPGGGAMTTRVDRHEFAEGGLREIPRVIPEQEPTWRKPDPWNLSNPNTHEVSGLSSGEIRIEGIFTRTDYRLQTTDYLYVKKRQKRRPVEELRMSDSDQFLLKKGPKATWDDMRRWVDPKPG